MKPMTRGERDDLLRLVRQRERVLKSSIEQRSAALLADFEIQMAKIYHFNDNTVWAHAFEKAKRAVEEAKILIASECEELGIPADYAPDLHIYWQGRGENAVRDRQAELRRAAKAKIAAAGQTARVEIERLSVQAQSEIVQSGLESDGAKEFFQRMPSVETLMPMIDPAMIEASLPKRRMLQ